MLAPRLLPPPAPLQSTSQNIKYHPFASSAPNFLSPLPFSLLTPLIFHTSDCSQVCLLKFLCVSPPPFLTILFYFFSLIPHLSVSKWAFQRLSVICITSFLPGHASTERSEGWRDGDRLVCVGSFKQLQWREQALKRGWLNLKRFIFGWNVLFRPTWQYAEQKCIYIYIYTDKPYRMTFLPFTLSLPVASLGHLVS